MNMNHCSYLHGVRTFVISCTLDIIFRGAELIAELMQEEIAEQQAAEREMLNKIKEKMERIKASQQLVQNQQIREPASHYEGEIHDNSSFFFTLGVCHLVFNGFVVFFFFCICNFYLF